VELLFAAIRRDARVEGYSIRELAEQYQVHRTVLAARPVGLCRKKGPANEASRLSG
jgi:hypothetical protein